MLKLIGIDPGTNYIGVSILTIQSKDLTITNIETVALDVSKINNICFVNKNLMYRLAVLTELIYNVMKFHNPAAVGMESPFINSLRPASVVPLSQSVQAIEYGIYNFRDSMPVGKYPPSTVKNAVGAKGGADKIEILDALLTIDELKLNVNFNRITDHEVDATAIAYALLQDVRNNPLILF